MKYVIPLAAMMAGCRSPAPRPAVFTPAGAGVLAQQLANEKARSLYHCQPFQSAEPAEFKEGRWIWHQLRGQGRGDLEANVEFKADGTDPKVTVLRLENVPIFPAGLR